MNGERPTRDELMDEIGRSWHRLNEALDRLSPEQMTEIRDDQGWSVKDHIFHLAAWERSMVFFLQGRQRHEALGVSEELLESVDYDAINAPVQQQTAHLPLDEARASLHTTHEELMGLLAPLSTEDLYRPNSYYLPDLQSENRHMPVIGRIYGNTAGHFDEHIEWIEALVGAKGVEHADQRE